MNDDNKRRNHSSIIQELDSASSGTEDLQRFISRAFPTSCVRASHTRISILIIYIRTGIPFCVSFFVFVIMSSIQLIILHSFRDSCDYLISIKYFNSTLVYFKTIFHKNVNIITRSNCRRLIQSVPKTYFQFEFQRVL